MIGDPVNLIGRRSSQVSDAFKHEFEGNLAAVLNVSADDVTVNSVQSGSIEIVVVIKTLASVESKDLINLIENDGQAITALAFLTAPSKNHQHHKQQTRALAPLDYV